MHAQGVNDSGDALGHGRGGGGEPVEALLSLPAQFVGRAGRGLLLARVSGAGRQAPLSMLVTVSSTRRRFSGAWTSSRTLWANSPASAATLAASASWLWSRCCSVTSSNVSTAPSITLSTVRYGCCLLYTSPSPRTDSYLVCRLLL